MRADGTLNGRRELYTARRKHPLNNVTAIWRSIFAGFDDLFCRRDPATTATAVLSRSGSETIMSRQIAERLIIFLRISCRLRKVVISSTARSIYAFVYVCKIEALSLSLSLFLSLAISL